MALSKWSLYVTPPLVLPADEYIFHHLKHTITHSPLTGWFKAT